MSEEQTPLTPEELRPKAKPPGLKSWAVIALAGVLVLSILAALFLLNASRKARDEARDLRRPDAGRLAEALDVEAEARRARQRRGSEVIELGPRERPLLEVRQPEGSAAPRSGDETDDALRRAMSAPLGGRTGSGGSPRKSVPSFPEELSRARGSLEALQGQVAGLADGSLLAAGNLLNSVTPSPSPAAPPLSFLEAAATEPAELIHVSLEPPPSEYLLFEGTLLPAVMIRGLNSDLPGQAHAMLRANVYDSVQGRHLLLPEGTKLLGEYDNRVVWGAKRLLVAWTRAVLPDGRTIALGAQPGVDLEGASGLRDGVNQHFVRLFGSALMLSAISAGVQVSQPESDAGRFGAASTQEIIAAAVGQELSQVSSELLRKNLEVQPTLSIRPGYAFNVEITADVAFDGPWMR